MDKIKVGIIGAGNISGIYLENGSKFDSMEVIAIADLDVQRAVEKAEQHGIKGYSVDELMADPDVQMVINLTIPQAHASVSIRALEAGKHVYVEKPFTVTREEAEQVNAIAEQKGLYVGSAPDTFLGGGIQTAIKVIEDGWIGTPIGATAFMLTGGHERWHPNPEFYYQVGGGPMFDMGPYYLTALVAMLGPLTRVTGSANISYPERTITSQPKHGTKIKVEVPTHIAGVLDFACGAMGTILTTFDTPGQSTLPRIEVYGSQGTLLVPDPNNFGGEIKINRAGASEWTNIPYLFSNTDNSRGLGAADMAAAIIEGRSHRASGQLGYHVLEAMHGIHDAAAEGKHYMMKSSCEKPALLPLGKRDFEIM
ncbi:MAG TPA: Gfo/Idh/MocA family oxidoreductase [Candidatus Paenibacillus intestinavium]|nr:Gfo/Idh/MocA family oxidoreductase [Candidatus Paenibacillus intestinavium]